MTIKTISDIHKDGVSVYSQLNENQLKHIYEPDAGLFIAESANVITRAIDAGYVPESFLIEENLIEKTKEITERFPDVIVFSAAKEVISRITGYPMTRGVLSAMRRRTLPDYRGLLPGTRHIAVLAGIENPTNMGAIFRSAAALGIEAVLVSSDSCDPLYRRAVRVSMGTVFQIPWTIIPEKDWNETMFDILKKNGYVTVAAAITDDASALDRVDDIWERKTAVFFGSEGDGLPDYLVENCDCKIVIPMKNGVDSLNVAAASAVIFWEMQRYA